jgi:hypothetical protein
MDFIFTLPAVLTVLIQNQRLRLFLLNASSIKGGIMEDINDFTSWRLGNISTHH